MHSSSSSSQFIHISQLTRYLFVASDQNRISQEQSPDFATNASSKSDLRRMQAELPETPYFEENAETPPEMSCELMPHQRLGLEWLMKCEDSSRRGSILADEVGLGKTIQALALILARRPVASSEEADDEHVKKPTLVVVPLSLLNQWETEIGEKVKPGHKLNVFIYHGAQKKQETYCWRQLESYDVVITTYDVLANEFRRKQILEEREKTKEAGKGVAKKGQKKKKESKMSVSSKLNLLSADAHFHRVILDEAQLIKNPNTYRSRAAMELKTDFRLCLTGTPLMNNTDELYGLLRFLRVKPYDDEAVFDEEIGTPLCRQLPAKEGGSESDCELALDKVRELLGMVMLRRVKEDRLLGKPIVEIPKLKEVDQPIRFSKGERELYQIVKNNEKNVWGDINVNGLARSTVLLQLCHHPCILVDDLQKRLKEAAGSAGRAFMSRGRDTKYRSAKIDNALELIESIIGTNDAAKILVFSSSTLFLDVLERCVVDKQKEFRKARKTTTTRFHYARFDGQSSLSRREQAVSHFRYHGNLLLMSIKAGGFGLNLQCATHILLTGPDYNPYVEEQAIGRAHRVGQTKPVIVYRLFVEGTVEEDIRKTQQSKKTHVRRILGDKEPPDDEGKAF
ncbi:Glutarate-semialdehyde dehydrogenase DavD [Apiospora arundinis]